MTTARGADRAVRRAAFWDGFWETFASPFALVLNGFGLADEDETPKEIANRYCARYGLPPLKFDPNAGSVMGAWYAVGAHARAALGQLEREYGEQVRTARFKAAAVEDAQRRGGEPAGG